MKNFMHFSKLVILMLSLSITAMGQYTGSYVNVAAFKVATAMDSITGFEPSKAVDNSLATYCAITDDAPAWLQVDLGTPYFIDGYGWDLPDAAELPKEYTIQGSLDGIAWRNIKISSTSVAPGNYSNDLTLSGDYRYVRIYITDKDAQVSFSEVYLFGQVIVLTTPPVAQPASHVTSSGFKAHWSERTTARGYILEVATDINFVNPVVGYDALDVKDVLEWDVTGLSPVTTYYYRVSSYNALGTSSTSNQITVATLNFQTITFDSIPAYRYGDADFDLTATASSGLPVYFTSSDETVASITGNTVSINTAGLAIITAKQNGNAEYDAALPVEWDLLVNPVVLTVSDAVAANKEYNGTTDAMVSGAVLNGVIESEDVILVNETTGTFAQKGVGTGIVVTTAMTITGSDTANYVLTQPVLSADIVSKELTVAGASADNKVYDGTTIASISGFTLEGVIDGDEVSVDGTDAGLFAQSGVGVGIAVTTSLTLSGAEMGNYTLVQPADLTADITAKDLMITAEDMSREACVSNPEFTVLYDGFVGMEDATILDPLPVAECEADESSPAGAYAIIISGGGAVNYNLNYVNGTLTVSPDVVDPVLTVHNLTVQLDDSGNASISPADVVTSASDNCWVTDTTLTQSEFTTNNIGQVIIGVSIFDAAGNSASKTVIVTVEGPDGFKELAAIGANIYPNPTLGKLELVTSTPIDWLKVIDMTGKTIISRSNLKMQESFDISNYSKGIYIFQLQLGDEMVHLKVIKK